MANPASQRFDSIAQRYSTSEVHSNSPTLRRLRELLPEVKAICDVACGAGHTGLSFAGSASRIVAVDPAPKMLEQVRKLADERGVEVETLLSPAEAIPLPSDSFDLVVSRLAPHHFHDVSNAISEMTRLAKPGGYVCVIDLQGDEDPELDALNHQIEVLHDPTHVRSYTVPQWRKFFEAAGLQIEVCEPNQREIPSGLSIERWCEIGNSGAESLTKIRELLSSARPAQLASLEIAAVGEDFSIPVRTLLILGRRPPVPA